MKKEIHAVIFDLDGTLLDTLEDLTDSCNESLRTLGYPEHTIDEVRQFVGNGLGVLMERALPDGRNNTDFDRALQLLREIYGRNWQNKTKPYTGVLTLIAELNRRGIKTGIVSNKPDEQVKELAELYFKGHINAEAAVGEKESEGIRRKPAPDSVFTVMKILGADAEHSVYIGDSDVDLATARNAGLPCISVCWGFRSRDFLLKNGATRLADKPEDIPSMLEEMEK